ncbi:angiotensin-converting enzyme-like [Eupeodes corollae]|uniref:angiotensin-converting enzyme-like n=1 Tax=Eupeodes corollae TaxID=290404 RepID=UPI00249306B0|nr:angiotensin-converting enzyme-like [Eupeodes corollae]
MDNLMSEIQPLYKELHAFIRKSLQQKYGDSIIESDGMIPHHLFEQVLAQTWSNLSIIENLFPFKNLPPIQSVLEKRFKSLELYEIADRFYQKLGFDEFTYKVWMKDIKMKNTSDDGYCSPYVYYQSPNVHLEYCEKMSFEMFLEIYSDMGKLYYAKEMTGLPGYFFNTHGLDEAIGKAAILSTSTYHNLKAIGMIVDLNVTEEVEMNRLLRKSIESLMMLPVKFVHIKLMEGLLSGSLDLKELNTKYWELMKKHVGVKPPMNYVTKPDVPDMPSFFYIDMNWNGQSFSFDMEIMSYQMYKKFCELGEKYPKEPLHLCDMHGTKAVGDLLKNMMRLGNSKPFNETIATMLPEHPGTSSIGILEYYSPVKEFLVKKNSEESVKPGWRQ